MTVFVTDVVKVTVQTFAAVPVDVDEEWQNKDWHRVKLVGTRGNIILA